jgi:hypothetical protein
VDKQSTEEYATDGEAVQMENLDTSERESKSEDVVGDPTCSVLSSPSHSETTSPMQTTTSFSMREMKTS